MQRRSLVGFDSRRMRGQEREGVFVHAQILPVPGSEVFSYFRGMLPEVLWALAVLEVYELRILRVFAVVRGYVLRILPDSQHFGARHCCAHSMCFRVRDSVLRVLQVLALFRRLVLRGTRYCEYSEYSEYARYTRSMEDTSAICAPCR